MRSRQRLLDILPTINPDLYPYASRVFKNAALELETGFYTESLFDILSAISNRHRSEYISELATDAIALWGVKP